MSRTPEKLSRLEYLALLKKPKRNKFGAKKTVYNGQAYDSTKEANRRRELDLLQHAPEPTRRVVRVETQVRFALDVGGVHICDYIVDFVVYYADSHVEYEDVKGYKKGAAYRTFKHKQALMLACHGITVKEI